MRVAVLGSGSSGNSVLLEAEGVHVLLDAGFSGREIAKRLHRLEVEPAEIEAIVVTHEHSDHTKGAGVFARRHGTPVYLTEPTRRACAKLFRGTERCVEYRAGTPFEVGPFRFDPFLTAHDAIDPVAMSVVHVETGLRLGVATDLGRPTTQVRYALRHAHLLILEANHDPGLLQESPYPSSVKQRIASSHGHLSNDAAAKLAVELYHPALGGVVLAHLSKESNRPKLAEEVVGEALRGLGFRGLLHVASQHEPSEFFDVAALVRDAGPTQLSLL